MFLYKNLFVFNSFCSFNPNHAYWNQRRLFAGNLPGMLRSYDRDCCSIYFRLFILYCLNYITLSVYSLLSYGLKLQVYKNWQSFQFFFGKRNAISFIIISPLSAFLKYLVSKDKTMFFELYLLIDQ